MAQHYASGTWMVKEGCEEQFVQRWTELIQWSRKNHPSMLVANLLHDRGVPQHFVSFAEWADADARAAWKAAPGFAERMSACVALCEHMKGADYDRVVTV